MAGKSKDQIRQEFEETIEPMLQKVREWAEGCGAVEEPNKLAMIMTFVIPHTNGIMHFISTLLHGGGPLFTQAAAAALCLESPEAFARAVINSYKRAKKNGMPSCDEELDGKGGGFDLSGEEKLEDKKRGLGNIPKWVLDHVFKQGPDKG